MWRKVFGIVNTDQSILHDVRLSVFILFQESLIQDLAAVRELCTKLDQTRESLSRQLAAKSLDQEQVRREYEF